MKSLALLLLVGVATSVAAPDGSGWSGFPRRSLEKRDTTANINDYMDRVLQQTSTFLVTKNLDPFKLTDHYIVNFSWTDLLGITYKVKLGLDTGEARGISTITRSNNATLSYTSDARTIDLKAAVVFGDIQVSYDYYAKLVIGPSGVFTATVKNLVADLDIAVNLKTFNATLNSFAIKSAKSITVDVTGLTFFGNLAVEAGVNAFLFFLKGPILNVIQAQVLIALQAGISSTDAGPVAISVNNSTSSA